MGKSRFFVDNYVQKVWITLEAVIFSGLEGFLPRAAEALTEYIEECCRKLPEQVFADSDYVPGPHCNEQISGLAVLL